MRRTHAQKALDRLTLFLLVLVIITILSEIAIAKTDAVYLALTPSGSGGTAFAVETKADPVFVTNAHVCGKDTVVFLSRANSKDILTGEVVATDPDHDLCLIKVVGLNAKLKAYRLRVGPNPKVGTHIRSVGFPLSLNVTSSAGTISSYEPGLHAEKMFVTIGRTTFGVIPGMSGSPVLDSKNRVIGVVFGSLARDGSDRAMFATLSALRTFLERHVKLAEIEKHDLERKIKAAATRHGVDPDLALAIARVESGLNYKAVGRLGEVGLFQLRPEYHTAELGDIEQNIDTAVRYLATVRERCKADYGNAWFVCFNHGPNKRLKDPHNFSYYLKVERERQMLQYFVKQKEMIKRHLFVAPKRVEPVLDLTALLKLKSDVAVTERMKARSK
jgi:hypothetical protein